MKTIQINFYKQLGKLHQAKPNKEEYFSYLTTYMYIITTEREVGALSKIKRLQICLPEKVSFELFFEDVEFGLRTNFMR